MKFNPSIFRQYDIRGIYGTDFDEAFAYALGRALVRHLNGRRVLIGHDSRITSPELAHACIQGITSLGGSVYYIAVSSVPFFTYSFWRMAMHGGIMITASHNGPEYSGFKLYTKERGIVSAVNGLHDIQSSILHDVSYKIDYQSESQGHHIGNLSKFGGSVNVIKPDTLLNDYTNFILKLAQAKPRELSRLKIAIQGPLSLKREIKHLASVAGLHIVRTGFDLRVEFDSDEDRILFFNRHNQPIRTDYIIGILAQSQKRWARKLKVVHDLRFSRGVLEQLKKSKIHLIRSEVGRSNIVHHMHEQRADLGGELSGHIYFKDAHYNELPLLTLLVVMKLLVKHKKDIDQLVAVFRAWHSSPEINIPYDGSEAKLSHMINKIKTTYGAAAVDLLDGITISYPDWWFNMRPSHTESLIRVVAEAHSQELLDAKMTEIQALMQ